MSWIEDATEVLAEGTTPEGKRMQIITEPVEYSGDMALDGDGYVPTAYLDSCFRDLRFCHGVNWDDRYGVLDGDQLGHVLHELRWRFSGPLSPAAWTDMAERWFRIHGAVDVRIKEVALDQSSFGVMVSVTTPEWVEAMGLDSDHKITDNDTEEFENWLKGDVSRVTAREAIHDCNCEYCEVEWVEAADVFGMIVYASPWDVRDGINGKYAYVLEDMIAESGMIPQEVAA